LSQLLSGLSEYTGELPRSKLSPARQSELGEMVEVTPVDQGQRAWRQSFTQAGVSMGELFSSVIDTSNKCGDCGTVTNNYEVHSMLHLPIPEGKEEVLLDECWKGLFGETKLGDGGHDMYFCDQCDGFREATQKVEWRKAPSLLFLSLKRQKQHSNGRMSRLNTAVKYPERWEIESEGHKHLYQLHGVICHMGELQGGHYWSYVLNGMDGLWYMFNDLYVGGCFKGGAEGSRETTSEPFKQFKEAYVLIYNRLAVDGVEDSGLDMSLHANYREDGLYPDKVVMAPPAPPALREVYAHATQDAARGVYPYPQSSRTLVLGAMAEEAAGHQEERFDWRPASTYVPPVRPYEGGGASPPITVSRMGEPANDGSGRYGAPMAVGGGGGGDMMRVIEMQHELIQSIMFHDFDRVCRLLREHPSLVNMKDGYGRTPLMMAALVGNQEAFGVLSYLRADAYAVDRKGYSAKDYQVAFLMRRKQRFD
jgi:hypothetical protein